jgi:hypothetical protein
MRSRALRQIMSIRKFTARTFDAMVEVPDVVIRSELYQRVRAAVINQTVTLTPIAVGVDEAYRPDLVAYRAYEIATAAELQWLVLLLADQEDMALSLPVGETLYFPELAFIRRQLNAHRDMIDAV